MIQKIFCFKFRNRRGILYLKTDLVYNPEKLFRGEEHVQNKFQTYIYKGTTYHPYAHLPDSYNIAISKKFREILIKNKISGWDAYPINIKNSEFEYYGLQILGRAGSIQRPSKPGWVKGMMIDTSEWDGSDIFSARDIFTIFFTEKVREVLLYNKVFSDEEMVDISTYEWYSA